MSRFYCKFSPLPAHGLTRYWHIGKRRNARATVAITAVQTANRSCIESKKKNMIRREKLAPSGRHMAYKKKVFESVLQPHSFTFLILLEGTVQGWECTDSNRFLIFLYLKTVQGCNIGFLLLLLLTLFTSLGVLHGQRPEAPIHDQEDRDEEGGDARGVHDAIGQRERLSWKFITLNRIF